VLVPSPPRRLAFLAAITVFVLSAGPPGLAQEFRGQISGRVVDESGGVLPGVTVTATNIATNTPSSTTTNELGNFTIPYLAPGQYTLTAELEGFKKLERTGVEVRVGDRLSIELSMSLGALAETVSVTAESPLLEMASGSQGQIIDERRIALLPLSDGNPFTLARLAPGVSYTGDLKFSRPFDNAGTSNFTADGGSSVNEFTLDGSPNMASGNRVAFVPPAGAVSEFKVETASFDAQQGHTGGANVNVTIKSGTNTLKGEGYYYYRDEKLAHNDFFLDLQDRPKSPLDYARFGGHAGAPIVKDKTFIFGAVEWLYDEFAEPGQFSVPTEKMRNGDFSELLPAGILIYDPLTAVRLPNGRIERQPFPGNIIPANRISPIAKEFLKYYPLPNQPGNAQQMLNYSSPNPRTDDFYSISLRGDHNINQNQRIFVRYTRNDRVEARGNWAGEVNGIRPIGNYLYRINDGVTIDHVWNMSGTSLLNLRGGWQRFQEPNVRQHEGEFDPASLGFSPATVSYFGGADYLPRFNIDGDFSDIGENKGGTTIHSIYSFQPTYTKLWGKHSIRTGYDVRVYQEEGFGPGAQAGQYDFSATYTRQFDNSSNPVTGQQLAALMLGQPTGGSIDRNATRMNYQPYHGVFVQDDWQVTDKLSLNLGLRYEYESAPYDTENRNQRGWDPAATLAITAAAQAAYARNPIPEIPPSAFRVQGGILFADDSNRTFWKADRNNVQPRLGFAYKVDDKTVARGGVAIYTVPFVIAGVRQPGFSQATNIVPTLDTGLTFIANLANPFPNGVAEPPGASQGVNTFLGRQLDRFAQVDGVKNPQNTRWAFTVQRELPGQWLVELGYVGSHGWNQTVQRMINPVPAQYLATSPSRDQATINYLTANVTNPFAGLLPGTSLNGSTVQRQQLLRPYPQFADIQSWSYNGSTDYHAFQSRAERRFAKGYTLLFAYTWSDFKERVSYLNPTDTELEERPANADIPHRFSFSGVWELPFGRDRKYGSNVNHFVNALIGDWIITAIGQIQSGRPLDFTGRNIYYDGSPQGLKASYSDDVSQPVFNTSGFYFHDAAVQTNGVDDPTKQRNDQRIRLANNLRYFPGRIDSLRYQTLNEWQLSFIKRFRLGGRLRAQINIEMLNAFNQAIFDTPNTDPTSANFGKVTNTYNLPGSMQIAGKITF
jgi:hypothetical protein